MFLLTLVRALRKARVPYAIVGGYAVALHGAVRGTVDIDIVVGLELDDLKDVETALTGLGLMSRIPVSASDIYAFRDEYIRKRNLVAWSFVNPNNPAETVDIIITQDLRKVKTKQVSIGNLPVRIIAKADLISMKQKSGRPQDLEDIRALKEL